MVCRFGTITIYEQYFFYGHFFFSFVLFLLVSIHFFVAIMQIIKNSDLEELQELGSGTFGTVYHGMWRGTDVAIKRIKKSCFSGRSSEQERLVSRSRFLNVIVSQ